MVRPPDPRAIIPEILPPVLPLPPCTVKVWVVPEKAVAALKVRPAPAAPDTAMEASPVKVMVPPNVAPTSGVISNFCARAG